MIESELFRITRLERFLLDHLGLADFPEEPDDDDPEGGTPSLHRRVRRLERVVLRQQQEIEGLMSNSETADQQIDTLTSDEQAMEQRVGQNTVDAAHQAQLQQDITGLEGVDAPSPAPTGTGTPGTPAPTPTPAPPSGGTTGGTPPTPTPGQ